MQSQVRFNRVPEKVPVKSQVRFNRVPEKVPEKVWEALVQPGRFNRVLEKVPGEGVGGFGAEPGQVQQGSGEGSGEGVPEKVLGIFVAGPGQVPTRSTGFPALSFAARFRKICNNKHCGCWGCHRSLFFLGKRQTVKKR